MRDQPEPLEAEVLALRRAVEGLEARVAELEAVGVGAGRGASVETGARPVAREMALGRSERGSEPEDPEELTLAEMAEAAGANLGPVQIGGIFLVLAGAFVLRSLTEGEVLSRELGVACGLVYAVAWAVACLLLGKRGLRPWASASGLAVSLVALPLIWESTTSERFQVLPPWLAAVLLLGMGAVLLLVAVRHGLAPVSAAAVLGLGGTALGLMFATRHPEPFALVLALLGVAAVFAGPRRGGPLPWFSYLFADLGALLLMVWSLGDRAIAAPLPAALILAGLFVATMVIIAAQSSRTGEIGPQQVFQGVLVTVLGFGGALMVAGEHLPVLAKVLGLAGLTIGAAGYAFLLVTFRWSREHRWVFLFHSTLALVVVAMCSWILFAQPDWLFAGVAVLLALAGALLGRVSPGLHSSMMVVFATLVGGLGAVLFHGLAAAGDAPWPEMSFAGLATFAAAVFCVLLPLKDQSPVWPQWLPRFGRGAAILVAVLGLDAVVIHLVAPLVAGEPGHHDAGVLAALRTGVLAVSVVVLAGLSHVPRLRPARWLVWPLLAGIALKLLAEDFLRGRAITMAAALLLYGVALILAPRLKRVSEPREGLQAPS